MSTLSVNFENLPLELIYEIAIRTRFEDLRQLCQVNSQFRQICQDPRFWQLKAHHDFGTPREIFDLLGFAGPEGPVWRPTPQTRYLEILSETNCTVESVELINCDTALICAASKGNYDLLAFFIAMINQKYRMPRLFDLSNPMVKNNAMVTCRRAGDSLGRAIDQASLGGSLEMIRLVISSINGFSKLPTGELCYDPMFIIARAMRGAAKLNRSDVLNYLESLGMKTFPQGIDYGLEGAAEGHHLDLLDVFWKLPNPHRWNSPAVIALIGAARGGHLDLVERFATDLVPSQFMMAFVAAAKGGSIPVLQYFIHHGITETSILDDTVGRATFQAARLGHTAVLQFLYPQFPRDLSVLDVNVDLEAAARQGHQSSVKYLLSRQPQLKFVERAWILAASNNHLEVAEILSYVIEGQHPTQPIAKLIQEILEMSVDQGSREGVQYALALGAPLTRESYALSQRAEQQRQYPMMYYLNWLLSRSVRKQNEPL